MSDMKCPFCGKKLWYDEQDGIYRCMKSACVMDYEGGTEQLWQELIRTRKALKEYANKDNWGCIEDDRDRFIHTYWFFDGCDDGGWVNAEKALEQIDHSADVSKKVEQKDVKWEKDEY